LVAAANSAALASYSLGSDDTLSVTTPALGNGQMASCWVSLTRDGRFAFVSNTASGSLSSYDVSASGSLSLSSAVAAHVSGSAPIDSALSDDGAFLYVDDSARGQVLSFAVHGASLTPLASVGGLPKTLQGIAVE
jgi:6-phosphogluconolactonase (cycloisomerase 2 family)